MPKIQGQFANGDKLPTRDYVDGDASGPGLNQVLSKTNAAPYVFATVAEAEDAEYSEPETVAVAETAQFYVYDSSSALTRDGVWVLNTGGTGRLVSILLSYVLSSGRAGGQTLNGGSSAGDDLTLQANATNDGQIKLVGDTYFGGATTGILFETDVFTAPTKGNQVTFGVNGDTLNQFQFYGFGQFQAINSGIQFQTLDPFNNLITFAPKATAQLRIADGYAEAVNVLQAPFIRGGTGSGVDLTLTATSNATNGSVKIGTMAEFDEALGTYGLGATPTSDIKSTIKGLGNTSATDALLVENNDGADALRVDDALQVHFANYSFPVADGTAGSFMETDGAGNIVFILPAFGEAYQTGNSTATTINTVNVWEEVDNFIAGENQGVTVASGTMTVDSGQGGVYSIAVALSGLAGAANNIYEFAFSVNDTILTKSIGSRKFASTTDAGSVSLNCLSNLSAGDIVKLEVRNTTSASNFTVVNSNMTIQRID